MAHNSPLRRYRLKKKLTTKELALQLKLAESTVRSLENGTRQFTAEQAVRIEGILSIPRAEMRPDIFR